MGVKVYYSEISANKEVKKHQQRVMMILESKQVPYEAIDITEAGRESDKEFMMTHAKPRGDSKFISSPQIFNDDLYCGDYDDFDLANENDVLEKFLNTPKIESNFPNANGRQNGAVGSREPSTEAEAKPIVVPEEKSEPVPEVVVVESMEPENLVEESKKSVDEYKDNSQPTESVTEETPAQNEDSQPTEVPVPPETEKEVAEEEDEKEQ